MHIHINLNSSLNLRQGIAVYSTEIIKRIIKSPDFSFEGGAYVYKKCDIKMAKRFKLKTKIVRIPSKFIFETKYAKIFPFNYNTLLKTKADVFVFMGNDLPKANIEVSGKRVCVIHDVIPLYRVKEDPEKAKIFYNDHIKEIPKLDRIITVSEYTKNEIVKYFGVSPEIIDVVYNGVDFDRYNQKSTQNKIIECKSKYNLPDEYIFYMGSAQKYKNIEGIIKAYALIDKRLRKNYKLVIANYREDLVDLAINLGIKNDIYFLNGIDEEDKVTLYQLSKIVIQISFFEGFGIPLIEAMAAGKPVVASNCTCIPEVVGDAGILVNPCDYNEISAELSELLINKEKYNILVEKGLKRAKEFNWEDSANKFLEVLKKI